MPTNDIDKLFAAAKSGDEKTAAAIGGEMKKNLSEEQKRQLERALRDGDYLKQLLSSDRARRIADLLQKKGKQ